MWSFRFPCGAGLCCHWKLLKLKYGVRLKCHRFEYINLKKFNYVKKSKLSMCLGVNITKTRLFKYAEIFTAKKLEIFR